MRLVKQVGYCATRHSLLAEVWFGIQQNPTALTTATLELDRRVCLCVGGLGLVPAEVALTL
jgi:hypothetical protein